MFVAFLLSMWYIKSTPMVDKSICATCTMKCVRIMRYDDFWNDCQEASCPGKILIEGKLSRKPLKFVTWRWSPQNRYPPSFDFRFQIHAKPRRYLWKIVSDSPSCSGPVIIHQAGCMWKIRRLVLWVLIPLLYRGDTKCALCASTPHHIILLQPTVFGHI